MTDHLVEALQSNFTTVKVKYDNYPNCQLYTFKALKSLNLQPGELVLVKSPQHYYRTVEIVSVDNEPNIDYKAAFNYKWIVGRIDLNQYNQVLVQEEQLKQEIEKLKRLQKQRQVIASSGFNDSDVTNLMQLGKMND